MTRNHSPEHQVRHCPSLASPGHRVYAQWNSCFLVLPFYNYYSLTGVTANSKSESWCSSFISHIPPLFEEYKVPFTKCFGSASDASNPKHLFLSEITSELDTDTYKKHSLECHPSMSLRPGYKIRALTNTCQNTMYVSLSIYKKHSPWYKQGRNPIWFLSLFCVSLLSELAFSAGFPPFSIRQLWQREFYLPLPVFTPESRCWVATTSAKSVMQFEASRDNVFLEKCIQSRCEPAEPKAWVYNRTGDRKKTW